MNNVGKLSIIGSVFLLVMGLKTYGVLVFFFGEAHGIIYSLLCFLFWFYFLYLFIPKKAPLLLISTNVFYSFILFSNVLYSRKFNDVWSVASFLHVDQLNDVSKSINYLFYWKDTLLLLDIPLLVIIYFLYRKKLSLKVMENQSTLVTKISKVALFITCTGVFSLITIYANSEYPPFEQRNSNRQVVHAVGFFPYYLQDIYFFTKNVISDEKLNTEEKEKIKDSFLTGERIQEGKYFGTINGQNILFVQMESMSYYLLNEHVDGTEITPFLNRLARENFSSNDMYHQIGGGHTSDAEYLLLTGQYPLEMESVNAMYPSNRYQSIVQLFKKDGYSTMSAHGYRKDFWNRNVMHPNLGFEQSWFMEDLATSEKEIGYIGMKDDVFYRKAVSKLSDIPQPFFSYLISLELHTPFTVLTKEDKELSVGKLEGTYLGNYFQSAHTADKALRVLWKSLEQEGLLENTTIVLIGDHDAEMDMKTMEPHYGELTLVEMAEMKRVPFIIVTPKSVLKGSYEEPMGQIDVAPSLLHLAGIVPTKTNFYGKNIFGTNNSLMVRLPLGEAVTKETVFLKMKKETDSLKAFDRETGIEKKWTLEEMDSYKRNQANHYFSERIIKTNMYQTELDKEKH